MFRASYHLDSHLSWGDIAATLHAVPLVTQPLSLTPSLCHPLMPSYSAFTFLRLGPS